MDAQKLYDDTDILANLKAVELGPAGPKLEPIDKLRKKIEDVPSDPRHILTVHGTGYRFEP